MQRAVWVLSASLLGAALLLSLGGCPTESAAEYVLGGTGVSSLIRAQPEVTVLTPISNLAITGGTAVEVNWRAYARSRAATLDVIIDSDRDPNNGNEIVAYASLPLTETRVLLDTSTLLQGSYSIGVVERELGQIVAYGYAPGLIIIDQAPYLYFVETDDSLNSRDIYSARDNVVSDRSARINLTFDVAWELIDPDSENSIEILLDPDNAANGNEITLYRTSSQEQAAAQALTPPENRYRFRFDLPTREFGAGTYRFLAVISDGVHTSTAYAPGSIQLRARLAGPQDLRNLDQPDSPIAGAIFEGFNPRDNAGSFLTSIGDIDADGFGDFIILSQFAKPRYEANLERTGIGEAYLVYGRSKRFSGVNNLNSVGTLFRGDIFTGPPEAPDPIRPSRGITSCAVLSDWDRDGVRELAFGLPFTDSRSVSAFTAVVGGGGLALLDPDGYFRTGAVVIMAGWDLRPDLGFPGRHVFNLAEIGTLAHKAVSCVNCDLNSGCRCPEGFTGPKAPYTYCPTTFFHQHWLLNGGAFGAARQGARFSSVGFGDQFGETISAWAFDSIIMSAPLRDPAVSVPLPVGTTSIPGAGVVSIFFNDSATGFYPWTNDNAPTSAAQSAGDGLLPHGGPYHYIIDDLQYSPGFFVDPDDADPCERFIDPRIDTPTRSVRLWSQTPGARLGNAKGLKDINGDGLLDLAIGVPGAAEGAGSCYIILGRLRDLVMSGEMAVEELDLPMHSSDPYQQRLFDGIRIRGGPGERLGEALDNAGDFNGDGLADVVIGSSLANTRRGGAVVFFGSRTAINLTQSEIPYYEIPTRGLGVIFEGENDGDLAGARVAGAGDVDGDGNDDILIAAPNRSVRLDLDGDGYYEIDRTRCGVVYLIYGSPNLLRPRGDGTYEGTYRLADVGTTLLPGAVFVGRGSDHYLGAGLGEQGDRTFGIASAGDVDGDGRGDILLGAVKASPRDRAAAGEAYLIYGD